MRRSLGLAALALVALLAVGAWLTASWSTAVLGSASMEPFARPGDLLLHRVVPVEEVQPGDVVTVPVPGRGLVTHRIIELDERVDGPVVAVLKGDRSRFPDPTPVPLPDRVERVVRVVPALGGVLQLGGRLLWAGAGLFLLGGVALLVARRIAPPPPPPPPAPQVDPRIEALLATCEQLQEDGVADVVLADLVRVRTALVVGLPSAEGAGPVLDLDDGGRFYVLAVADADQAMLALVPPDSVRRHDASEAIDLWWEAVRRGVPDEVARRLEPWLQLP